MMTHMIPNQDQVCSAQEHRRLSRARNEQLYECECKHPPGPPIQASCQTAPPPPPHNTRACSFPLRDATHHPHTSPHPQICAHPILPRSLTQKKKEQEKKKHGGGEGGGGPRTTSTTTTPTQGRYLMIPPSYPFLLARERCQASMPLTTTSIADSMQDNP
jgi:hypothetical protein